jgi:hypothetical protein
MDTNSSFTDSRSVFTSFSYDLYGYHYPNKRLHNCHHGLGMASSIIEAYLTNTESLLPDPTNTSATNEDDSSPSNTSSLTPTTTNLIYTSDIVLVVIIFLMIAASSTVEERDDPARDGEPGNRNGQPGVVHGEV